MQSKIEIMNFVTNFRANLKATVNKFLSSRQAKLPNGEHKLHRAPGICYCNGDDLRGFHNNTHTSRLYSFYNSHSYLLSQPLLYL